MEPTRQSSRTDSLNKTATMAHCYVNTRMMEWNYSNKSEFDLAKAWKELVVDKNLRSTQWAECSPLIIK